MRRLLTFLFALAFLSVSAHASTLPEGVLPPALAEAAEESGVLDGGLSWLLERARTAWGGVWAESLRAAMRLVLVALLCGAAEGMAQSAGDAAARYVPLGGVLAAATLAAGDLHALLGLGTGTLEELAALSKLLLPTVSAALASSGFVSTASVWQVTTLLFCDTLCAAATRYLLPLIYCHIAASVVNAAQSEGRMGILADGLKSLLTGALKLLVAAFAAYLSVAGVLTGSADRATIKAAKAALSGAVPVVGSALSDAAESVLAAASATRGTVGALGVFAILAACLTPMLQIGAQLVLYKFAAFAAGLVGPKALSDFLDRLGDAFALVFAMTAACALVLLASMLSAIAMTGG